MRLAIIRQRYTPYGGAERFIEGALEALLERNVAITLYTREWPQTKLQLMEPQIVDPFYLGSLWRDVSFARAVCREVGRSKANLVQSHERLLCCDIYRAGDGVHAAWLAERMRGRSALARLRVAMSPHHRYILHMERRLFASPWLSAVICNSRMVRDEIRDHFGVAESKLHVIYNAVDGEFFSPALRSERIGLRASHGIPDEAPVFLLVGSGYERKNVATALRALAELPPPAWLVVVGRDKRPAHYASLASALGIANRVTFAGAQADPRPYFGAADVFLLPTLYDPFPNAALEAMACGLPVITSTKSGAAELVLDHDAGLVCPSRDIAGLAAHMRVLLDPALRERMGHNARRAIAPLTPAAMTLQLVLLYKQLMEASLAKQQARKRQAAPPAAAFTARAEPPAAAAAEPPAPPAEGSAAETQPPAAPAPILDEAATGIAPGHVDLPAQVPTPDRESATATAETIPHRPGQRVVTGPSPDSASGAQAEAQPPMRSRAAPDGEDRGKS
ncbi:MAG TPA: glycosyltransferase [Casimicrobiaceae bacterium]|nr:glycosyltransferase [Casimicrobiaceae bacterium]